MVNRKWERGTPKAFSTFSPWAGGRQRLWRYPMKSITPRGSLREAFFYSLFAI
jgi:hypothetical protein